MSVEAANSAEPANFLDDVASGLLTVGSVALLIFIMQVPPTTGLEAIVKAEFELAVSMLLCLPHGLSSVIVVVGVSSIAFNDVDVIDPSTSKSVFTSIQINLILHYTILDTNTLIPPALGADANVNVT